MKAEIVNIVLILTAQNAFDCVVNFVALTVVSQFENLVLLSLRNEALKKLLKVEAC